MVDGSRIYVAKHGEADPGVLSSSGSGVIGTPAAGGTTGAKVNLNTATLEPQLGALPGIGPS